MIISVNLNKFDIYLRKEYVKMLYLTPYRSLFDRLLDEFWTEDVYSKRVNGELLVYVNDQLVKRTLKDGTVEWYKSGRLHNESGPAVQSKAGDEYWLNGRQVSKDEVEKYKQKLEDEKKIDYKLSLTKAEREKIESALGRKLE
jgi:hypothetical protein